MNFPIGMSQEQIVRLLVNLRRQLYPWMHILHRVDGTVVVTISPRPGDAPIDLAALTVQASQQ